MTERLRIRGCFHEPPHPSFEACGPDNDAWMAEGSNTPVPDPLPEGKPVRPESPPIRELVTAEDFDSQAKLWRVYWVKLRIWRGNIAPPCVAGGLSNRTCANHGLPLYPDDFCNEGRP